jgi:hypothetical protein
MAEADTTLSCLSCSTWSSVIGAPGSQPVALAIISATLNGIDTSGRDRRVSARTISMQRRKLVTSGPPSS